MQSRRLGDCTIFELAGEIDMSTAPRLAAAVEGIRAGSRAVVVDLGAVVFLDSSALNMLLRAKRTLQTRGIALRVASPPGSAPRRSFELTGLVAELGVTDSLAGALEL